jgi:hypothetical protein
VPRSQPFDIAVDWGGVYPDVEITGCAWASVVGERVGADDERARKARHGVGSAGHDITARTVER